MRKTAGDTGGDERVGKDSAATGPIEPTTRPAQSHAVRSKHPLSTAQYRSRTAKRREVGEGRFIAHQASLRSAAGSARAATIQPRWRNRHLPQKQPSSLYQASE